MIKKHKQEDIDQKLKGINRLATWLPWFAVITVLLATILMIIEAYLRKP